MSGRTIWHAQDCAWWSRERVVELGEEFGPAGPAVANWLECQAKLQNSAGRMKSGYRAVARGAFLRGGADEAERVIAHAVAVGFLKDFEEGSRTFTATVAAFRADQSRGKDTLARGDRRTAQSEETPRTDPDNGGENGTCPRESREEERTTEEKISALPLTPPASPGGGADPEALPFLRLTFLEAARKVACPECGAQPGSLCSGSKGPRKSCHSTRHASAITAGAPVLSGHSSREEGTNPRAMKPGEPGWAKEHFPNAVSASAVKAAVTMFQQRSKAEPTPEAIREYAVSNPMYASQLGLTDGQAA